jgi:hypothetical protein
MYLYYIIFFFIGIVVEKINNKIKNNNKMLENYNFENINYNCQDDNYIDEVSLAYNIF